MCLCSFALCRILFIKRKYERCIRVLDFRRLNPTLLQYCSDTLHAHAGGKPDVIFLCGRKGCKTSRPGRSKRAHKILEIIGEEDINFIQKSDYNVHYGFHGLKYSKFCKPTAYNIISQILYEGMTVLF